MDSCPPYDWSPSVPPASPCPGPCHSRSCPQDCRTPCPTARSLRPSRIWSRRTIRNTKRIFFEILLNQPEIRLYLPFSDRFGSKRTSVWFQINQTKDCAGPKIERQIQPDRFKEFFFISQPWRVQLWKQNPSTVKELHQNVSQMFFVALGVLDNKKIIPKSDQAIAPYAPSEPHN